MPPQLPPPRRGHGARLGTLLAGQRPQSFHGTNDIRDFAVWPRALVATLVLTSSHTSGQRLGGLCRQTGRRSSPTLATHPTEETSQASPARMPPRST